MPFIGVAVGTTLVGERCLTDEEFKKWSEYFPHNPNISKDSYFIATKYFCLMFIPLIPLETFVFYYTDTMSEKGVIVYSPAGKGKIYWKHAKPFFKDEIAVIIVLTLTIAFIIWLSVL